jgi:hypothetical protein
MSEGPTCPKCGAKNPEGAKFCNNCGTRLQLAVKSNFEGLAYLHLATALYVLLSVAFNALVRASPLFLGLYVVAGVLGMCVAYALSTGKVRSWIKPASLVAIIAGLTGTTFMFIIGLEIKGVIGPAWVLFLATAWKLWKDRVRVR